MIISEQGKRNSDCMKGPCQYFFFFTAILFVYFIQIRREIKESSAFYEYKILSIKMIFNNINNNIVK